MLGATGDFCDFYVSFQPKRVSLDVVSIASRALRPNDCVERNNEVIVTLLIISRPILFVEFTPFPMYSGSGENTPNIGIVSAVDSHVSKN